MADEVLREKVALALYDEQDVRYWNLEEPGIREHFRDQASRVLALPEFAARAEDAARLAEVERERDSAQEHMAYHLADFRPLADPVATGDLAVDMAHYASRMRAERDEARAALGVTAPTASEAGA